MSDLRVTASPRRLVESSSTTSARAPSAAEGLEAPSQSLWFRTEVQETLPPRLTLPKGFPKDVAESMKKAGIPMDWLVHAFDSGLSAEDATEALHLSMLTADAKHFGMARLALELIQRARAQDGLSPEEVRSFLSTNQIYYVMRPDGVLASAISGEPVDTFDLKGNSGFEAGALYRRQGGLLHNIDDPHAPGLELPLRHDAANSVLDGIVAATQALILGGIDFARALTDNPLETIGQMVAAMGNLPETAVKIAFESPADLERFRHLPPQEQAKAIGQIVGNILLSIVGAKAAGFVAEGAMVKAGGAARAASQGLAELTVPQFRIMVPATGLGPSRALILTETPQAPVKATAMTAAAMASLKGPLTEPRVRQAVKHHLRRRGIEDPRLDAKPLRQLQKNLDDLADAHPNVQTEYVRHLVERLDETIARAPADQLNGLVSLEDLTAALRATKLMNPEAHAAMQKFAERRLRRELDHLLRSPPSAQKAAAQRIVAVSKEGGLNLAETLSMKAQAKLHQALAGERVKPDGVAKAPDKPAGAAEPTGPLKVAKMEEFFETEFGAQLKASVASTSRISQGQTVYTVRKKLGQVLRKGDQVYLDALHKDHLEVFDARGSFMYVLNLDGTRNLAKTEAAKRQRRTLSK